MTPDWTDAIDAGALATNGCFVFKHGAEQVAIFRLEDGRVFAVDNRCPHEGYPLAQGTVNDCVVTCNWHNYKFDLKDGQCIMGEEAVRSFPVRVVDGRIEVDLQPPDPAAERARLYNSLDEGLTQHHMGRVARDVVRLLEGGLPPARIALYAARWDALYAEYGSTHVLPVAADVLRFFQRYPGVAAARPLVQLLDLAGRSHVRRPLRPQPPTLDPGTDPGSAHTRFLHLVEAEDAAAAEGLFRGALQAGWPPEQLLRWLQDAVGTHFLSFGHPQIYLIKAEELLQEVGWEHADPILTSLVLAITTGTREDLLPKWSSLREALASVAGDLDTLFEACTVQADPDWRGAADLTEVILDARRSELYPALLQALRAGAPIQQVLDAIAHGAAERHLRFNTAIDADTGVQDSWLTLTHTQTYTNAVREALRRRPTPALIQSVLFAARFVNAARPLDVPTGERLDVQPATGADVAQVLATIAAKQGAAAVQAAAAVLDCPEATEELREALEDLVLHDPLVRPIVVAHAIKNTVIAFDEHRVSGDPHPVLGLVYLLASPISERRIRRVTEEAIDFVTTGRVPRILAD